MQLTDDGFENSVVNAAGPVLVEFWSNWNNPSKMIAPIMDDIADEYEGITPEI